MRKTIRCLSRTIIPIVAVLLLSTGMALGQVCPPGAPQLQPEEDHTTGLASTKTCPPSALSGTQYDCDFEITNGDPNHCVENLTFTATAPIGVDPELVDCEQAGVAVTRLGWAGSGLETCAGTITETAPFNCGETNLFFTDQVAAAGTDQGGISPDYEPDFFTGLPISASPSGTVIVPPLVCPEQQCNETTCSEETGCGLLPLTSSVDPTCTDTDGTLCTQPGCEAGVCIQDHTETICEPDADLCTEEFCELTTGECVSGPPTVCPPDANLCNEESCEPTTGECVSGPDRVCEDPVCQVCETTTGDCIDRDPQPPECVPSEVICRTPGFWGTHGGLEKSSSEDTTCDVLANFGGTLVICGEPITNCDLCSDESALEAICVSPKGDSSLQLARQLTAAALNCAITKATDAEGACVPTAVDGANPCSGLGTIEDLFQACNAACPGSLTGGDSIACIGLIDCFNNGFAIEFDEATNTFSCGALTGCEENESGCFDQTPPKPAGSSFECRDSRKNCITIFGPIDDCVDPICE